MRQKIAVLGSTGSIGEQTLEVLGMYPESFEVTALTACTNWRRLAEQARAVMPDSVVIADGRFYEPLKSALADLPIKVWSGEADVAGCGSTADVVVNALVGWSGLIPTIRAVSSGKKLALANKESLVVAGELVMRLAGENSSPVVPIDSEHSAILQCLTGERSAVRRIILTASGGALRDVPLSELGGVTAERALAHPNWKMGPKITIDSATLVNKGFEVVEARWLFDLTPEQIDVLVHPQSIVHSMVEFADGALKAQLGTPDMRVPIAYALSYPARMGLSGDRLDLTGKSLTFSEVEEIRYPALRLVRGAMTAGGTMLCALNAVNEIAVDAFLRGRIGFLDIVRVIERTLSSVGNTSSPSLDDYVLCNDSARGIATGLITKFN